MLVYEYGLKLKTIDLLPYIQFIVLCSDINGLF